MTFIDILREHLDEFNQAYEQQMTSAIRQAIYAMLTCRTNTERASQWTCQVRAVLITPTSHSLVVIAAALNTRTTPRQIGLRNSNLSYCPSITTW